MGRTKKLETEQGNEEARFVGIRHRVKAIFREGAEVGASPTEVAICQNGKTVTYDLPNDTAELDWVRGHFPVAFRKVDVGEDLSVFRPHHIEWRKLKKGELIDGYSANHCRMEGKEMLVVHKVPATFDGLRSSDTVAMVLGGSGDRLAFAISRLGDDKGVRMMRVSPAVLKAERGIGDKKDDAVLLSNLVQTKADLFYLITPRDRNLILLREVYRARIDAMKARIGCEQRLRQHFIGGIFCTEADIREGDIEQLFDEEKANDSIFQAMTNEEARRERELIKLIKASDIYKELFEPIEGCGPMIAARLITAIQDIRRFSTKGKLTKFCGAHVQEDGIFPRQRSGQGANWHGDARQALYLIGDQFNRRPNSVWGLKLREYKEHFRRVHPEVLCKTCGCKFDDCTVKGHKRSYNDGHIHKMATWRTITKFVEWLWKAWWEIEERQCETKTPSSDIERVTE